MSTSKKPNLKENKFTPQFTLDTTIKLPTNLNKLKPLKLFILQHDKHPKVRYSRQELLQDFAVPMVKIIQTLIPYHKDELKRIIPKTILQDDLNTVKPIHVRCKQYPHVAFSLCSYIYHKIKIPIGKQEPQPHYQYLNPVRFFIYKQYQLLISHTQAKQKTQKDIRTIITIAKHLNLPILFYQHNVFFFKHDFSQKIMRKITIEKLKEVFYQ